ncbi:GNAT family N-acetyltransferase [Undibacterium aquatile]|uniref:GNAT family N-acetyltransferase n=1 Tax=Undibacterium aquatile TaxID=1537398 RepID=A0ABR6XJC0_9BURK|nr:GNAT family N-acetyltransferase [Undibacterium aquatile]MBC3812987.1 GNAT family N-acetyltransferase [Undibacterium aquatile]
MNITSTDRLVIRLFETSDAAFVLELLNDPSWIKNIGDRGIRNLDQARDWILAKPLESQSRCGFSFYVVTLKDSHVAIGICGLIKRETLRDVDIGYAFLPRYSGQGYAIEAARATMRHAEQDLGLTKLAAITSPDNVKSNSLLKKMGFVLEEVLVLPGEERETNLYAYRFPALE